MNTDPWAFRLSALGDAHERRYDKLIPFLEDFFSSRPIRVLEIGVYRAGFLRAIQSHSRLEIASYVGVDPYLGSRSDSYFGAYWGSKPQADSVYREAATAFSAGQTSLCRTTSVEFFRRLASETEFDFIYVDGDHRFLEALRDLHMFFPHVAPGGVLGIDDYANVDTPAVTRATNIFLHDWRDFIQETGGVTNWFLNAGKQLPVVQVSVFVRPSWGADERLAAVDHGRKLLSGLKKPSFAASAASVIRRRLGRLMR